MQYFVSVSIAYPRDELSSGQHAFYFAPERSQAFYKLIKRQVPPLVLKPHYLTALLWRKVVHLPHLLLIDVTQLLS